MLKFLGYLAIMLAIIPITGLLAFGSWKHAMQYTRDWAKAVGWLVAVACVVSLIMLPF